MPDQFAPPATELLKIAVAAFPTPGQGLALDQTGKIPSGVGVSLIRNKEFSAVDVQNTATETSVSNSIVIANSMGATGALRLALHGDVLYNRNTADTLRFRIKFGSTTAFDYTTGTAATNLSGTRRSWEWEIFLANTGLVNAQYLTSRFSMGVTGAVGTTTTGIGDYGEVFRAATINSGGSTGIGAANGTLAVDTSSDQALTATVQWSTASASNSFRKFYSLLELF